MKKWLGFIAILVALLIPMPVMAIGVSPYTANIDVLADGYGELVFTVTECSAVDVSLENIPLVIEPSHILVVSNQITVRIYGDLSKPTETYQGYLVVLESGQQVGSGVKVSLTVNHVNDNSVILTATVLGSGGGGGWSGWSGGYPTTTTPSTTVTPPIEPVVTSPPPIYTPPKNDTPAYTPEPPVIPSQIPDSTPWFYLVIVFGGLLGIYGLIRWLQRKG